MEAVDDAREEDRLPGRLASRVRLRHGLGRSPLTETLTGCVVGHLGDRPGTGRPRCFVPVRPGFPTRPPSDAPAQLSPDGLVLTWNGSSDGWKIPLLFDRTDAP